MPSERAVHPAHVALRRRPRLLPGREAALRGRGPRPLLDLAEVRPRRVPVPERPVRPAALLLRRRRRLRRQVGRGLLQLRRALPGGPARLPRPQRLPAAREAVRRRPRLQGPQRRGRRRVRGEAERGDGQPDLGGGEVALRGQEAVQGGYSIVLWNFMSLIYQFSRYGLTYYD